MGIDKIGKSGSEDPKRKRQVADLNEMLLGGLKSRAGKETVRWVTNLAEDGSLAEMIAAAQDTELAGRAPSSLVAWVDKLFDAFQQYEVEFNRQVEGSLAVTTERPEITPEMLHRMQGDENLRFLGKLVTREWTLSIRGNLRAIEGFVVPSDHLIAFIAEEWRCDRYFLMEPVWHNDEVQWQCNESFISFGKLRGLAKQLFGGLIKVARGEASERDPFVYIESAEQLEAMRHSKEKAEDDPLHMLSGDLDESPPNIFPDGGELQSELSEVENSVKTVPSPATAPAQSDAQAMLKSGVTASDQSNAAAVGPAPFDSSLHRRADASGAGDLKTVTTTVGGPERMNEPGDFGILAACEILARAVDRELEMLAQTGAEAFKTGDLVRVEFALKRANSIRGLRDRILSSIEEWRAALSE